MYGSYPQNASSDDLTIEYEQRLLKKLPINILAKNTVENLKVSSTERSFDNIIYESDPQDSDFDDLPFDGDERLITRQKIYCINDDIIFRLKNGLSVEL